MVSGCADWAGSWELDGRSEWTAWLNFLGVPEVAWDAATKAPDFHRYVVTENEFIMDHRIPGQSLHLYFTANIDGEWATCPYPQPTATLWKDSASKAPAGGAPGQWRHQWVEGKRGVAFETEIIDFAGKGKIVRFTREIVSTQEMKFTVHVLDDNGKDSVIGPCFTTFKKTGWLAPERPMVALVIGATGGCGRNAYNSCKALGIKVKAMARDADKAREVLGADADIVLGDVSSADSMEKAFAGVTSLIIAIGKRRGEAGSSSKAIDYEGVCNIVAAAKRCSISKIVHVTSNGVDSPNRPFICFLNYMTGVGLGWKLRGEQAIRDSGIPYVVVRPVGLNDTKEGVAPIVKQCAPYEWGMCMISREVVGLVCANSLKFAPEHGVTVNCREDKARGSGSIGSFDWQSTFSSLEKDEPIPCQFEDHEKAALSFARKLKFFKWCLVAGIGAFALWLARRRRYQPALRV